MLDTEAIKLLRHELERRQRHAADAAKIFSEKVAYLRTALIGIEQSPLNQNRIGDAMHAWAILTDTMDELRACSNEISTLERAVAVLEKSDAFFGNH